MGTIDSKTKTITCTICKTEDQVRALDKGSNYGGPYWKKFPESTKFKLDQTLDEKYGPTLHSAKCIECSVDALIT